ncbi:MAG: hypothetical protein GC181_14855 [Bacteroidetes bacterium]|nr:hypothetical protein [Bacteroidota bacterium]
MQESRIIGITKGRSDGPVVLITAAVHGNEGSGVTALEHLFSSLNPERVHGEIHGLIGNMPAFKRSQRFIETDLNRLWTAANVAEIESGKRTAENTTNEFREQVELFHYTEQLYKRYSSNLIFIDLHSTSSQTEPFLAISDSIVNRSLASHIPVPILLGLEEYLHGTFLNLANTLGCKAFVFEGGQHDETETVVNQIAFLNLMLHYLGITSCSKHQMEEFKSRLYGELSGKFFEVLYRQEIKAGEDFMMKPGYINFSKVAKDESLALLNDQPVFNPYSARLFMPLYQKLGSDGFFLIREISPFPLWLSSKLRKISWTLFLTMLPGVRKVAEKKNRLRVNRKKAKWLVIPLFHLLGYRCRFNNSDYLIFDRREP